MAINRKFTAQCDKCEVTYPKSNSYSSDLKEFLKKDGWQVGNQLYCPTCRVCPTCNK